MKDPIKRPIFLMNEIAQKTSQKIMNELQELIDNLLKNCLLIDSQSLINYYLKHVLIKYFYHV